MPQSRTGRLALCFLLGAAVGTGLDGIHAYGDTLSYDRTAFGRWAWFVPLEFGLVGVLGGLILPRIEAAVARGADVRWTVEEHVGDLLLFPALYVATSLVPGEDAGWLAAGLLALAGLRLIFASSPGDWFYVVALAILGPAGEILISATGAFDYAEPDFLGIPYWLPALWANAGFFMRRLLHPIVVPRVASG